MSVRWTSRKHCTCSYISVFWSGTVQKRVVDQKHADDGTRVVLEAAR